MDILHLSYFLAVAHHKSFTKASKALHISQPSISKSIRTLEEEWGVDLFYRHSRSVELTEAGQILLPRIKTIVTQFHQLEQHMSNAHDIQHGTLSLGIPPMVGSSFLAPLLAEFHALHPYITISVEEWGSNKVAKNMVNGSLQVGFIALPINEMPKNNYIFNNETLRAVLPIEHRLASYAKLTPEDIKDEPFAFFTEDFSLYQSIISTFRNIGIDPNIVCRSSNWDFLAEMVRAGLGIALLPDRICQRLPYQHFKVLDITPPINWRISMVWGQEELLSNPTRLWIDYFKNKVPEISSHQLQSL